MNNERTLVGSVTVNMTVYAGLTEDQESSMVGRIVEFSNTMDFSDSKTGILVYSWYSEEGNTFLCDDGEFYALIKA